MSSEKVENFDSPKDYFNLCNPSKWVKKLGYAPLKFRLGMFDVMAELRKNPKYVNGKMIPAVGVIHVPVANLISRDGKTDYTAERMAAYLANPGEKRDASVHICSDRDSYVLCLPFDTTAYGCGNPRTNHASINIEIGGLGAGKDIYQGISGDAYWSTADAVLKYIQTAKAVIHGCRLLLGKFEWTKALPPLQRAKLNPDGSVLVPGWTQHREIPIWNKKIGFWNQVDPKSNQVLGQHSDICQNFPWEVFFDVFKSEINKAIVEDTKA